MGFTVVGKMDGDTLHPLEVWEYCRHTMVGDVIQHDGGYYAVRGNNGNSAMLPLWDVTGDYIRAVDPDSEMLADLDNTQDAYSLRSQ